MSNNYPVTRRDALTMLSGYNDTSARQFLNTPDMRGTPDVIKAIVIQIKASIETITDDDEPLPELDLSQIPNAQPKAQALFYAGTYLRKMMNKVNRYLKHLSDNSAKSTNAGTFRHSYIYAKSIAPGTKISLCWKPRPEQAADPAPLVPLWRVIVLGRLLKTLFSTDLMRGARSMARELGAELDDRRTLTDAEIVTRISDLTLHDSKETAAIVLYFVQRTHETAPVAVGLDGYTITRAGFDDETSISLDYNASARQIMEHLVLRCDPNGMTPRPKVVLLQFHGLENSHPLRVREGVYDHYFSSSGRFQVERLALEYDFEHDSTDAKGFDAIKTCIENDSKHEIVAILGRSHQITLGVIDVVKPNRGPRSEFPIRVFGENITTDLLDSLNDENSPLEAICSADPYYVGRYIVRAALTELRERANQVRKRYDKVPPLLITKDTVRNNRTLYTIDRLPDVLTSEDVRLDREQFAWQNWMIEHCPKSYGPHLYAASRKRHSGQ